jgi:hypothetical protein
LNEVSSSLAASVTDVLLVLVEEALVGEALGAERIPLAERLHVSWGRFTAANRSLHIAVNSD